MEKQRRDRMNKSLENIKIRIIHHDPNHTSKLEKADILEKAVELFRFFEHRLAQFSHIQHQTAVHTIRAIFEGLRRLKASSEVVKAVEDVVALMFAPPRAQPISPIIYSHPLRRGTKRSPSSSFHSLTDDSGISEGSPPPKKLNFSIDGILK